MMGFRELVIGGVLFAPFVGYAATALGIMLLVRPLLRLAGFERAFSHPAAVMFCLYVMVLAALLAFF